MKVNDVCAMYVRKFISRRNVFLNVSDEFRGETILDDLTYGMFCKSIESLIIVLDENNNLSINGKTDKHKIIIEIIGGIRLIAEYYGRYSPILISGMEKFYNKKNLDILWEHYAKLILYLGYIISSL